MLYNNAALLVEVAIPGILRLMQSWHNKHRSHENRALHTHNKNKPELEIISFGCFDKKKNTFFRYTSTFK